ncbi:hypothetical protein ACEPAG_3238 [Sanghuangporus baumii]
MPAHIEQVIFTDLGDGRGVRQVYRYTESSGGRRYDSSPYSRASPTPPPSASFPNIGLVHDYYPDNEEHYRGTRPEHDRPSRQLRPHPDDYDRRRREATPPPPPSRKSTKNKEHAEARSKPWDPNIPSSSKAHSSFPSSRRESGSRHSTAGGRRQHPLNNEGTAENDNSRRRTEGQDNSLILMPHLMFVRACLLLAKNSDIKKYFEPRVKQLESISAKIESIRPDDESFKDKLAARELEFLEEYLGGLRFSKDMVSIEIDIKDSERRNDLTIWITARMAGAMEVRNNLLKGTFTFRVTDYDNYP